MKTNTIDKRGGKEFVFYFSWNNILKLFVSLLTKCGKIRLKTYVSIKC
jgi:hypothetical protein